MYAARVKSGKTDCYETVGGAMEKDELKKLQEKHRKEAQEIRAGIKARKKRTHRLIVRGAILEKAMPETADMDDDELLQILILALKPERIKAYREEISRRG